MKPLGDAFIALIKMMIAPVIFCTVVHGIGSMRDLSKVGRVGVKTLLYFEVVSTVALAIGLMVGELLQPGKGFNIDPATLDPKAVANYVTAAKQEGVVGHLLGIIPDSFFGALARGDILQVLLVSILSGFVIARLGAIGEKINYAIDAAAKMFFGIIRIIVRVAPIGAFGAMAFTIGAYGLGSLVNLLQLIGTFYLTSILFVLVRARHHRPFRRLLDPALHRLHQGRTVDRARHQFVGDRAAAYDPENGAARRVEVGRRAGDPDRLQLQSRRHQHLYDAGDAVPRAGDQHAAHLRPGDEHSGDRMLTSKGASGVTGAGFVTLAATLAIVPDIPIQSIAIILGIDKFMSECRALTNLVGNGVATVVISRWEGELDVDKLHETMAHPIAVGEEMEAQPI